jgi:hypothetical protein
MKRILFAIIAVVLMSSFNLPKGKLNNPELDIKLVKNADDEWEFVIHNNSKYHIDEFWVGEIKEDEEVWHHGHFEDGDDTSIAPGETMTLTVYNVGEGDYYLYTIDNVAHKNHMYKLHLDHDVDVDDSLELEEEEMEEVFGKKVDEDFEPEDDDKENDGK